MDPPIMVGGCSAIKEESMKVGVLGTGDVGRVLATGFVSRGHEVKLGTRDPGQEKVKAWVAKNGTKATAGTFEETAKFGELLVLATLWDATPAIIQMAKPESFSGKVVIDTTNPLDFSKGAPPKLSVGGTNSAGEEVQRLLSKARVVKAFNSIGNAHMVDPKFPGGPPDFFLAGNDAPAKKQVTDIAHDFGWSNIVDLGGIESARYLEPLAMVWILEFFRTGNGNHAVTMVRK
jgi:predicted dinucleotide-binding enzyme